jgi:hypothetical protein
MNAHNLDAMVACFAGGRDDDDPKGLRVAEFAAAVGVGADTIRSMRRVCCWRRLGLRRVTGPMWRPLWIGCSSCG